VIRTPFLSGRIVGILAPMGPNLWLVLAGVLLCFAAGSLFALAEGSLLSLSKWQARQQAERSGFAGRLLQRLLDEPSRLITALVLGSTAAQIGFALSVLWLVLYRQWRPFPSLMALLGLFLLMEVAVKEIGVHHSAKWPLRLAPLIALYSKTITPLAMLFEAFKAVVLASKARVAAIIFTISLIT